MTDKMVYLLIIGIVFSIRLFPRFLRPLKTDIDTWYHISSVSSIIKNNYKIPECNFGFKLGGKYDYPYFAHWISAVIFKTNIIKYEKYIGPLIDTLYILIGYFYFKYIFNYYQLNIVDNLELLYFLLTGFSITMLKISTGPRVYSFTPRVFGEVFIFLFFVFIHIYFLEQNVLFILIAMLFSALALNTSTFGSQVLFFITIVLSFLLTSWIPIVSFLLSVVLALIISNGHYKNIILQQLKYTYKYATYGQFNHPAVKKRNKLSQYLLFFKLLLNLDLKKSYTIFMSDLTFLNIFYKNLDVLVGIFLVLYFGLVDDFIYSLIIAFCIIFVLTSFKPFLFLGESDRYLDYLVIFTTIVILLTLEQQYIYVFIGIQVVLYLLTLALYLKSSDNYGKNFLDAMKYINQNIKDKNNHVIHGILSSYINYPLSVLTELESLAIEANYVFKLANDKKLMPKDTLYTNDFEYLNDRYGVNIIIANKKYLNKDIEYDFSGFDVFYENEEYIVYKKKD